MSYVYEKPVSVAERIAALKKQTEAPDAFKIESSKVGASANNRPAASNSTSPTIPETNTSNPESRWNSAGSSTKPQDDNRKQGEVGQESNQDDGIWQSAMNRFEQESTTSPTSKGNNIPSGDGESEKWDAVGYMEENYPQVSQDERDREYSRRTSEMDMLGLEGMDCNPQASTSSGAGGAGGGRDQTNESEITEKMSLWGTFMVLYKRQPMMKYYLLGLLIMLIAAAAIIGLSLSQKKSPSSKDCSTSLYVNEPFHVKPQDSASVSAGGFGTSVSASTDYLVVGAPTPTCNSLYSCDYTIGGGAYLYKRNNNNEWSLYSTFILDDGVSLGDEFGKSVSISEDSTTVAVGAPKDDELGIVAGAVYVMETPFSSTTPPIRLVSNDIGPNDMFGVSVSVSTTTVGSTRVTNVVAGASQDDDYGSKSGGVYVFAKFDDKPPSNACGGDRDIEPGKFVQCQKLLPDDGGENDHFGGMVNIAGRTIVVGAMWDDDRGIDSGAAYVFSLGNGGNWSFQQKILPVNFESQANRFGVAVATSGDRIVIGADLDDSQGEDSGAAYVYRLVNRAWTLETKLIDQQFMGNHRGHECGASVDISNDGKTVLVGCPGAGDGVVNVYSLEGNGRWAQTAKFMAPASRMGGSVALSGVDGVSVAGSEGEVSFSYRKDC